MTLYKRIALSDLEVNPANDRHGDLGSEAAAIEWLLVNKTEKMKDLLEDIFSKDGMIFEEPLVMKKPGQDKYTVFDGNRRVTCLKLLNGLIPNNIKNPVQGKVDNLKSTKRINLDKYVECRIESDINVVNDILERRHIPGNSGAGQLKWDGHEKENFLERTRRTQKLNFAREINKLLVEGGYLAEGDRIPLSTFNRLFSSKDAKRRVGVDMQDGQILLINGSGTTYAALTRIAKDMIAGKRTLDDVWDNTKKMGYLDELEKEYLLPSANDRLEKPQVVVEVNADGNISSTVPKTQMARQRDYLLPTNLPSPDEKNPLFSFKFRRLFYELQNTLRFSAHEVSISISFRTFLEILTDTYIKAYNLNDTNVPLAKRMQLVFSHLNSNGQMPEEARSFVSKLDAASEYFSINTLHKVAHHDFHVSENDLRSFVNNLDAYLREAILRINTRNTIKVA